VGGAEAGAALVAARGLAGVAFTGSGATAKRIQRTLADAHEAILPLVAETGGVNLMIVDSTALPEQVTDAVIASAFRSAGQRCSALRVLALQDEIAAPQLRMIREAVATLRVGDPADPATDLGPVIDEAARERLVRHLDAMRAAGRRRPGPDHRRLAPLTGAAAAAALPARPVRGAGARYRHPPVRRLRCLRDAPGHRWSARDLASPRAGVPLRRTFQKLTKHIRKTT